MSSGFARKNIFLDFMCPDNWISYPSYHVYTSQKYMAVLKKSLNYAILLCEEFCMIPPSFITLSPMVRSVFSACNQYVSSNLVYFPVRESSLGEYFEKKKSEYFYVKERYPGFFDSGGQKYLLDNVGSILYKDMHIGRSVATKWQEAPDVNSNWSKLKEIIPSRIEKIRNVPIELIGDGKSITLTAIKTVLGGISPELENQLNWCLQHEYIQTYLNTYNLTIISNIPPKAVYVNFHLEDPDPFYNYMRVIEVFDILGLTELVLNLCPDGIVELRNSGVFLSFLNYIHECLVDPQQGVRDRFNRILERAARGLSIIKKEITNDFQHADSSAIISAVSEIMSITENFSLPEENMLYHERTGTSMEMRRENAKKITILYLSASPQTEEPLLLDEEVRDIQDMLRKTEHRDCYDFVTRWAVRATDIFQAINEQRPTIIHFSGHGTNSNEIVVMDLSGNAKLISVEAMSQVLLSSGDTIRLALFNACFSEKFAESATQYIDFAIGMGNSISDKGARVFAAQLYSALGFGHSLRRAFDQAIASIMMEGIDDGDIPRLFTKEGVDANITTFIS